MTPVDLLVWALAIGGLLLIVAVPAAILIAVVNIARGKL